jgi:hypothetical protein
VPKSNEVIFGVWGGYLKASPADEECFNTTPQKKERVIWGALPKFSMFKRLLLIYIPLTPIGK